MPFDGVVTKSVVYELKDIILSGRIEKITQPENDEIFIHIRAKGQNLKLLLSANSKYPRIHLTKAQKENPATPHVFCMLLRKHLLGGKVLDIEFCDFERMVILSVESSNELGDISTKKLIIEIMGKYSNIILLNSENKIIDSVKHVDQEISSVREVMPARPYAMPPTQNKSNPETMDITGLIFDINAPSDMNINNYLLNNIKGFSPLLCNEICKRIGLDGKTKMSELTQASKEQLKQTLQLVIENIRKCEFNPCIINDSENPDTPIDLYCLKIMQYNNVNYFPSINDVLDEFYFLKDRSERLHQKKYELLKMLNNHINRCNKKLTLHKNKLEEVENRENLKLFGELILANIHSIPEGTKSVSLLNYYSESEEYVTVPLDENLLPQRNAARYFKQFNKAKTAFSFAENQLKDAENELMYLESVLHTLENCTNIQEISEVRQELIEEGYLPQKNNNLLKKYIKDSKPLYYKSSDGFDIYVGKNNKQNDLLTMKLASSKDTWLHTKNIPGSHVIIKYMQKPIPESTLKEAAIIAAFHSRAKLSSNVPVDYTTVKNVKKPSGAKPGMVIYENYSTVVVTPDTKIAENKLIK